MNLRELVEAASPGPWETTGPSHVCSTCDVNDARVIKDKGGVFTIAVLLGDSEWAEGTQEANARLASLAHHLLPMQEALKHIIAGFDIVGEGYLALWRNSLAEKTHRQALAALDKAVEALGS
jgi:hypothetical protein